MKARKDYKREEANVMGAYLATQGGDLAAENEAEIAKRARCSAAVAFRVRTLRRGGTSGLIDLWTGGVLTLRQTERIVLACAFDEDEQLREAAFAAPLLRKRGEGP